MKTVIVTGDTPVPEGLRTLVERGSTSLREHRAAELVGDAVKMPDADRIVFWTASQDSAVKALVERYARAEKAQRREVLVLVTSEDAGQRFAGLPQNECFVWPRDEDRLKMAFLTGA